MFLRTMTECQGCRGPLLVCLSFLELHQDIPLASSNPHATHVSPQGTLPITYLPPQDLPCPALLVLPHQAGPCSVSHSRSDRLISSVPGHAMSCSEPSSSLQEQSTLLQRPALPYTRRDCGRLSSKALARFISLGCMSAWNSNSAVYSSHL